MCARTVVGVHVAVIGNREDDDAGFVGERLAQLGASTETWHRESWEEWPDLDPTGVDHLVLLGSDWSVYWPAVAGPVAREAAIVRAAQRRGIGILAICFGSQLVAHAFGAAVRRAPTPEIGWYRIESDAPECIDAGPWMQWHSDVVALPPGATELARSPVGPQAWRLPGILAVQFHPEATMPMLERWTEASAELARLGIDAGELRARSRRETRRTRPLAHRLVDWYLAEVATVRS
jgi:GMP synthase-like glutamine amidotransferase